MVIAFIIGSDATLPLALPMLIVLNPKKTQFITFNQANSPLLLPSNHPRSQSLISTEHHVTAAFSASPDDPHSPPVKGGTTDDSQKLDITHSCTV